MENKAQRAQHQHGRIEDPAKRSSTLCHCGHSLFLHLTTGESDFLDCGCTRPLPQTEPCDDLCGEEPTKPAHTPEKLLRYAKGWLKTLAEIEAGVDESESDSAMTTFERNLLADLRYLLEDECLTPATADGRNVST